ncbi:MAG: hypothetical protein KDK65_01420 [Chlamydiia bacterium]|nr:hypothetical protein [Chlamydiia bacterium]
MNTLTRLFVRFRYPVSLPEDVANALGISISNWISFETMLKQLSHPNSPPKYLAKYMPRAEAEEPFHQAPKKEHFCRTSLFSFYFNEGWLAFKLQFDEADRLRRLFVQHPSIPHPDGIEIPLSKN